MEYISFRCAHCQGNLRARQDAAGLNITCPICKHATTVPQYHNGNPQSDQPSVAQAERPSVVDVIGERVSTAVNAFRAVDYPALLPDTDTAIFRQKSIQWVLLLGITPLILFQLQRFFQFEFAQVVWLIQGYYALLWGLFMFNLIQPRRDIWGTAVRYALFTATIGIPILLFTARLPIFNSLVPGTSGGNVIVRAIGFILGVGLLEEACKALPLLLYGLRKGQIRSPRDGLFLGFVSGLAFAAAEGVQYTLVATMWAQAAGDYSGQVLQILFRLMTGPVLHGAMAGTVGWFIARAATSDEEHTWPIITAGIVLMGTLHGLYNTFSGQLLGIGIAGLIFTLFLMYLRQTTTAEVTPQVEAADPPANS